MKTTQIQWQGWWLAILMMPLMVTGVRADNACIEGGPYTNSLTCLSQGTLFPGYGLLPTSLTAGIGQFIVPPTAVNLSITNGLESYYVTYDCHPEQDAWHTNSPTYTFNTYFVPAIPSVFWTAGTYTYTGMVVATGSPCSPLTNTLGTVTINVAGNNPDVLLDVDFGGAAHGGKTGYAVIGDSSADAWNYYSKTNSAAGSLTSLLTAEGVVSPVGLLVTNLSAAGTNGSTDAMYNDYLGTNAGTATVTLTNLPSGTWNVLLYAQDGNFTLTSGGNSYGTQTCHDSSPSSSLAWQPSGQYVVFQNVVVTNGLPLTVTVSPGTNGAAVISGLQIASLTHVPPPISAAGNVVAWGDNTYGETNVPAGLTNVVAIAGGYAYSLALKDDGTVAAWGDDTYGQTNVPAGLNNVMAIAGGLYHSLALKGDGTVVAWGFNAQGETSVPAGLTNVVAIAGGGYHSLALKGNATVVAWGYNGYGQTSVPVGLTNVVVIACGYIDSLALKSDGTVVAWGWNDSGQTSVPAGLTNVVAIAADREYSLALKGDGTVVRWGGPTNVPSGLTNVLAVAGGYSHSLALNGDGTVVAWGSNNHGQTNVPAGLNNVVAVAAGYNHSLALCKPGIPSGEIPYLYKAGAPGTLNGTLDSDYDGVSDLQELADRTNPNDANSVPQIRLGYWPFDNTNSWAGAAGQLPLQVTNITGVPSWSTNAALIDNTNGAVLTYRDVETNGNANINLRIGSVRFWFKPDWSSTNAGGVGPQNEGRLIELGAKGSTNGWWGLAVDPTGTNLYFSTQGSATNTLITNLSATITWTSNLWHQIVLTYSPTNASLYIDGLPAVTNGIGVTNYPSLAVRAQGFTIGGSLSGTNQARGTFDELETFNYPLNSTNACFPDWWELRYFGHLEVDPNTDTDDDGVNNLQEYQNGTDPTDYFNGTLPNIRIVNGYNQSGLTNSWLAIPLALQVTDTNAFILTNAPLTFTVTKGSALIAASSNGVSSSSIQLKTGTNGQAVVWLQLPSVSSGNIVTASAQSGTDTVQVNFYEIAVTTAEASMVAIGGERIMELTGGGDVVSWGGSQYGELGDYTHVGSTKPVHVVGLTDVTKIASGFNHSLAIDSNGALWTWGQNNNLQLGDGGNEDTNSPEPILGMTNVVAITAHGYEAGSDGGYGFSLALKDDGMIWMWGSSDGGFYDSSPTPVDGISNAVAMAGGDSHILALLSDGTILALGDNSNGQLGDNGAEYYSDTPVQITSLSNIVAICAGDEHSLAIDSHGNVWSWGWASYGQLGDDITESQSYVPVMVVGLTNVVEIAAGALHSLALDSEGQVWAWGNDSSGQLGDGALITQTNLPMKVLGMTNIISIAAGSDASVALDNNGNLWQWGASDHDGANWPWGNKAKLPSLSPQYADFYNGQLPVLTIMSGDNQTPQFQQPLVFRLTDTNGVALSNAPASIEVVAGDMELQAMNGGGYYKGLRVLTDSNGDVSLTAHADHDFFNSNCVIRVLAASRERSVETNFYETLVPMPMISITSPDDGNTYLVETNQTMTLSVNAQPATGGSLQEVDYYYKTNYGGNALIGVSIASPYSFIWTNALWWTNAFHAQYTLTAVAIDTDGASFNSSISFSVALDTDGLGLPDYWQLQYFGHLGMNPNSSPDGNGQNLLYDYQNGIDPTDYYAGVLPNLAVLSGNNQGGDYESFLPMPVTIQVTGANSSPLADAPVVFTVTNGTALLAASITDAPASVLSLQTDTNGEALAWVYFPASGTNLPDSTILASATSGTNSVTVTVNEYALLSHWPFDDTNTWVGTRGQLPLQVTDVVGVPSWSSNAVWINGTNQLLLAYRASETNGSANINCQTGTLLFYFKPDWSDIYNGGSGPGTCGRLIEIGNYNPAFTNGWWGLYLSPDGTQLSFGTSTNGGGMTNLSANVSWNADQWYQIALAYSPTNSALYIDGQLLATGAGVTYYPNADELTNGFRIGSDQNGTNQAEGAFDELQIFDSPLNAVYPVETFWFGIPDDLANTNGTLGSWEMQNFGHLGLDPNADPDGDGTNLLYDYQNGLDPNVVSFSFSVPDQYVSTNIINGVVTILGGFPSSIAVLVDSTNFSSVTWNAYNASNVTVNLGSAQGSHDVWIGLRGLSTNSQPTWEDTTIITDTNSLSISITNPANNVSLNSSRINIGGNFSATSFKQITVNGVLAFVNGTNFEAVNVPLEAGTNSITAIIEDLSGETNTSSIYIIGVTNSDGTMNDPVDLQATPGAGFAPLDVIFQVQTNMPGNIQQVSYDFNGDDIPDFVTNNLDSITNTYVTNGEYFPVVIIQTDVGRFSSIGGWNGVALDPSNQPVLINVQSAPTQTVFTNITDPVDLKWDGTNLYVLSGSTATITEFDTNATVIRSLSGIGSNPSGLDVDAAGNVYVTVTASNQVWKLNPTSDSFAADTAFGVGGIIGLTNGISGTNNGEFNTPFDVAVSADGGTISVSDSGNDRIQQFSTADGSFLTSFGSSGSDVGQFNAPKGLTYGSGGTLYIVDSGNNRIVLAQNSGVAGVTGTNGTTLGQFNSPINISMGERGVYVADTSNNRIQSFRPPVADNLFSIDSSAIRFAISTNFSAPAAVAAVDSLTNEMFYVADTGNDRIILCNVPADSPDTILAVWNGMTNCVANGDISGAIACFSVAASDKYREAFISVGTANTMAAISQIGTLTPVYILDDKAQFYFTNTISGQTITFPVEFNKENGVWKILEF